MRWNIFESYKRIRDVMNKLNEKHVSAYAAKTAYFIMLSFIPFLMLFCTIIRYTPLNKADVLSFFVGAFPSSVDPLVISMIDEIYGKSSAVLSVSVVVVLWSAGKGVTAMIQGLNSVFDVKETRNYLMLRIYGAIYTVLIMFSILVLLVLVVFGNKIQTNIRAHLPLIGSITEAILENRFVISVCFLILIFAVIYRFMPNTKIEFKSQIPGAVFTAISWSAFSFGFSVYVDHFSGMMNMYGSLTTLIIVMLWLYMCMYIMLTGALVNEMMLKKK